MKHVLISISRRSNELLNEVDTLLSYQDIQSTSSALLLERMVDSLSQREHRNPLVDLSLMQFAQSPSILDTQFSHFGKVFKITSTQNNSTIISEAENYGFHVTMNFTTALLLVKEALNFNYCRKIGDKIIAYFKSNGLSTYQIEVLRNYDAALQLSVRKTVDSNIQLHDTLTIFSC